MSPFPHQMQNAFKLLPGKRLGLGLRTAQQPIHGLVQGIHAPLTITSRAAASVPMDLSRIYSAPTTRLGRLAFLDEEAFAFRYGNEKRLDKGVVMVTRPHKTFIMMPPCPAANAATERQSTQIAPD